MKKGFLRLISILLTLSLILDPLMASAVTGPSPFVPVISRPLAEPYFQEQALETASRLSGLQVLLKHAHSLFQAFHRPTEPTYGAKRLNEPGFTKDQARRLASQIHQKPITEKQRGSAAKLMQDWLSEKEKSPIVGELYARADHVIKKISELIDLLKNPQAQVVIDGKTFNYEIVAVPFEFGKTFEIDGVQVDAFHNVRPADPAVPGDRDTIQLFVNANHLPMAGLIHEGIEWLILPQDPTIPKKQHHFWALIAEALAGGEIILAKGIDSLVPARHFHRIYKMDSKQRTLVRTDEKSSVKKLNALFTDELPTHHSFRLLGERLAAALSALVINANKLDSLRYHQQNNPSVPEPIVPVPVIPVPAVTKAQSKAADKENQMGIELAPPTREATLEFSQNMSIDVGGYYIDIAHEHGKLTLYLYDGQKSEDDDLHPMSSCHVGGVGNQVTLPGAPKLLEIFVYSDDGKTAKVKMTNLTEGEMIVEWTPPKTAGQGDGSGVLVSWIGWIVTGTVGAALAVARYKGWIPDHSGPALSGGLAMALAWLSAMLSTAIVTMAGHEGRKNWEKMNLDTLIQTIQSLVISDDTSPEKLEEYMDMNWILIDRKLEKSGSSDRLEMVARHNVAVAFRMQKKYEEAEKVLTDGELMLGNRPLGADIRLLIWRTQGQILSDLKQDDAAESIYSRALAFSSRLLSSKVPTDSDPQIPQVEMNILRGSRNAPAYKNFTSAIRSFHQDIDNTLKALRAAKNTPTDGMDAAARDQTMAAYAVLEKKVMSVIGQDVYESETTATEEREQAIRDAREMMRLAEAFTPQDKLASDIAGLNNIGLLLRKLDRSSEAKEVYQQALERAHEKEVSIGLVLGLWNSYALTLYELAEDQAADEILQKAKYVETELLTPIPRRPNVGGLNISHLWEVIKKGHGPEYDFYISDLRTRLKQTQELIDMAASYHRVSGADVQPSARPLTSEERRRKERNEKFQKEKAERLAREAEEEARAALAEQVRLADELARAAEAQRIQEAEDREWNRILALAHPNSEMGNAVIGWLEGNQLLDRKIKWADASVQRCGMPLDLLKSVVVPRLFPGSPDRWPLIARQIVRNEVSFQAILSQSNDYKRNRQEIAQRVAAATQQREAAARQRSEDEQRTMDARIKAHENPGVSAKTPVLPSQNRFVPTRGIKTEATVTPAEREAERVAREAASREATEKLALTRGSAALKRGDFDSAKKQLPLIFDSQRRSEFEQVILAAEESARATFAQAIRAIKEIDQAERQKKEVAAKPANVPAPAATPTRPPQYVPPRSGLKTEPGVQVSPARALVQNRFPKIKLPPGQAGEDLAEWLHPLLADVSAEDATVLAKYTSYSNFLSTIVFGSLFQDQMAHNSTFDDSTLDAIAASFSENPDRSFGWLPSVTGIALENADVTLTSEQITLIVNAFANTSASDQQLTEVLRAIFNSAKNPGGLGGNAVDSSHVAGDPLRGEMPPDTARSNRGKLSRVTPDATGLLEPLRQRLEVAMRANSRFGDMVPAKALPLIGAIIRGLGTDRKNIIEARHMPIRLRTTLKYALARIIHHFEELERLTAFEGGKSIRWASVLSSELLLQNTVTVIASAQEGRMPDPAPVHRVTIPTPLRAFTGKKETVKVRGADIDEILETLGVTYHMMEHLFNEQGARRATYKIQVDGVDESKLADGPLPLQSQIAIVPSMTGGSPEWKKPARKKAVVAPEQYRDKQLTKGGILLRALAEEYRGRQINKSYREVADLTGTSEGLVARIFKRFNVTTRGHAISERVKELEKAISNMRKEDLPTQFVLAVLYDVTQGHVSRVIKRLRKARRRNSNLNQIGASLLAAVLLHMLLSFFPSKQTNHLTLAAA